MDTMSMNLTCFSSKTPPLFSLWPFFGAASKLTRIEYFGSDYEDLYPQKWLRKITNVDLYPLIPIVFL